MLRRLKQDVAQQLPKKRRTVVVLDKCKVQLKSAELTEAAEGFGETKGAAGSSQVAIRQSLLLYYRYSGIAKIFAVVDYVKVRNVSSLLCRYEQDKTMKRTVSE